MIVNEIKKLLYKQKPKAFLIKKTYDGIWVYASSLKEPRITLDFEVPESDMGDAKFEDEMEAQLLIRWLKGYEN